MTDWELHGLDHRQAVPGEVNRIPQFDPRTGDHFWVLLVAYKITDPDRWYDPALPDESRLLDTENLVQVSGVGCYYCEEQYREGLRHRRCVGSIPSTRGRF